MARAPSGAMAGASRPGTASGAANELSGSSTRVLACLTRLNDKPTLKVASDELSALIRALDQDGLSAMMQSVCSPGAWEPKPPARRECIRALGLLALPSCPLSGAVLLPPHAPRLLAYLKKQLQDADGSVRDAAAEALSCHAWALSDVSGSPLPGSAAECPLLRVVMDCLCEQKKEGHLGASAALLMVAPHLSPLDQQHVKTLMRLLRSTTFHGTAALLAAIASTDAMTRAPSGLLKSGPSAFEPYLSHLLGQPVRRLSAVSGENVPGSSPSSSGSGVLGCLGSKDWAVRRAAADAVRAAVLLLGPRLEPAGCWGLGDPGSLTQRCLGALDACRFDKVREARETARQAVALLQELSAFVVDNGPEGDWTAWVAAHAPSADCTTPKGPSSSTATAPERRAASAGSSALRSLQASSCFLQAAHEGDLLPVSDSSGAVAAGRSGGPQQQPQQPVSDSSGCSGGVDVQGGGPHGMAGKAAEVVPEPIVANATAAAASTGPSPTSRSGSTHVSRRAGSLADSRRVTAELPETQRSNRRSSAAEQLGPPSTIKRQDTHQQPSRNSSGSITANMPPNVTSSGRIAAPASMTPPRASVSGTAGEPNTTWAGPSAVEWADMQMALACCQAQQAELRAELVQAREAHTAALAAMQERVVQLQRQLEAHRGGLGASGTFGNSRSGHAIAGAAADSSATALSPAVPSAGALPARGTAGRRGVAAGRPWQSVDCSSPAAASGVASASAYLRHSPAEAAWAAAAAGVSSSCSGTATPCTQLVGSSSGGVPQSATPTSTLSEFDLDAAYTDALRGERGDVHLLRLAHKSGPVWEQLSAQTADALLAVFTRHVSDGSMLCRVLPWLWRLTDEDTSVHVTSDARATLLDALQRCPAPDDSLSDKVALLRASLEAVWVA